ncbi:hypothetical protein BNJ_00289 [Kaumoebavirus]|uniref:hypothetical protein n=1 Tax=Kaumoebavirus TaxID=1859492 RepID=UPI0009C2B7D7|nr:hypothetical protein BNJ_00289 [Kaumoebavirus]ARA72112.1 hypothetical protein BNJ_00289 [Kaumoebavirus]
MEITAATHVITEDVTYFLRFIAPYAEELAALYLDVMMYNMTPTPKKFVEIRKEADYLRRVPICLER